MKLSFILLFIFYSLCQFNNPQNMGIDSNGNTKIGNSASGLPIFQTPTGSVLYPVPSSSNNNAVEWVEMNDFLSGSIIVGVDDNKMPIFKLNNGDIAYITIKPQDIADIKLNNNIVPLENNQINTNKRDMTYAPPVLSPEEKQQKFEKELEDHFTTINITQGIHLSDLCYVPFGRGTCAPHFIISGAMKSGTTSLFSYLLNHPNILPLTDNPRLNGKPVLAEKEVRYFNDPTFSQMLANFGARGSFEQYLNVFKPIQPSSMMITGESSPMYICQPFVATRINLMLPYVKNIILLRNPIDRMYSEHWFKYSLSGNMHKDKEEQYLNFKECAQREINMYKHCGISNLTYPVSQQERSFVEVCHTSLLRILSRMDPKDPRCNDEYKGLCLPNSGLRSGCSDLGLRNSMYYFQLIEWVEQFPDDRLLIIPSEQLYSNPAETVEYVTEFLGLSQVINFDWSFIGDKAYNIVNPKTQNTMQPLGGNTLSIGEGDSSTLNEKYPQMEEELRRELEDFFSPFNHFLAKLLNRPNFWDY